SPLGINIVAVPWRVDLDVAHTFMHQRVDFRFDDRHDVPKKLRMRLIGAFAQSLLEGDGRKLVGGGQGHLDIARGVLLKKVDLVFRERLRLSDSLNDNSRKPARSSLPALPCAGYRSIHVQAFDGFMEVAHKSTAAQLAVGKDFEP